MLRKYIEASVIRNPDGTYCVIPPWVRDCAFVITEEQKAAYLRWLWLPIIISSVGAAAAGALFATIPFVSDSRLVLFAVGVALVPLTQLASRWMVFGYFRRAMRIRIAGQSGEISKALDSAAAQTEEIYRRNPWFFSLPITNPRALFWIELSFFVLFSGLSLARFITDGEIPDAILMVPAAIFGIGMIFSYRQAKVLWRLDKPGK